MPVGKSIAIDIDCIRIQLDQWDQEGKNMDNKFQGVKVTVSWMLKFLSTVKVANGKRYNSPNMKIRGK